MSPQIRQLHPWNVTVEEAVEIQQRLRSLLVLKPLDGPARLVGGADVSYALKSNHFFAAIVIVDLATMEIQEAVTADDTSSFPYIPGLLSFREVPILLKAWEKVQQMPDVLIVDGQGIAHPRGLGLAAHLGLLINCPTAGCAKTKLVGSYQPVVKRRGAYSYLSVKGERVGAVLCTKDGVNPIFVSPGHLMDIGSSMDIVLASSHRYRLPEPVRQAHLYANQVRSSH